jgi:hypothetical protein
MLQFRLTKYDPALRDPDGAFRRPTWTSVNDIGRVFAGHKLTCGEYDKVEFAYVRCALAFMREAGVKALRIDGLEYDPRKPAPAAVGTAVTLDKAGPLIAAVLREEFWCRFEAPTGFIHVGYDFYLYVGVASPCPAAIKLAQESGLFVEPFSTPHRDAGLEARP